MMPSPRPGSTRQVLADMQFAVGTIPPPNPVVVIWRWRYELALTAALSAGMIAFARAGSIWAALTGTAILAGVFAGPIERWPAARRFLIGRMWCVITPHRVRTGCAQAWIHSRGGKIPIVVRTMHRPFGERVQLWCRAGTSVMDFEAARHVLTAACWASDIHITRSVRFAQVVTLDVIRHAERYPGDSAGRSRGFGDSEPPAARDLPPASTIRAQIDRRPVTWPDKRESNHR